MEVDHKEVWDWESKNSKAKKKIIKRGCTIGVVPEEGSCCKLLINKISGKSEDNFIVDQEFEFTIGDGNSEIEALLERCVITMTKEEEAFLKLGEISITLILLDFSSPTIPQYCYDIETAIKKATEQKEKGVEHYNNNRISEAYSKFRKAIRLLILSDKSEEKVLPLYINVCSNIAWCHFKLNRPEDGIVVCNKVLEHDEKHVKALLRRAACYNKVRDFEKAYSDLISVLKIENNAEAKSMLVTVKADLDDMNKRYKSMVMKMFRL